MRFLLLTLLAALLLCPRRAFAGELPQERSTRLTQQVLLRGPHPVWSTYADLGVPELRTSKVLLRARTRVSELIDLEQSVLNIMLDGRPLRSMKLSSLSNEPRFSLGTPGAGFHQIQLRLRLVPLNPVCGQEADEQLWVEFTELEADWQAVSATHRTVQEALTSLKKNGASIQLPSMSRELISTYLTVHESLRTANFPVTSPNRQDAHRLRFTVEEEAAPGRVEVEERGLLVVTSSQDQWPIVGRLIARGEFAKACDEEVCLLPHPLRAPPPRPVDEQTSEVLAEYNFNTTGPGEFLLRGQGELNVRLPWQRPQGWEIDNGSGVELLVHLPSTLADSGLHAWVELSLGERPLESWRLTLSEGKPQVQRLWAPLPEAALDHQEFDLRVLLALRGDEDEPCAVNSSTAHWLRLDSGSGFRFRGRRLTLMGLSGLAKSWSTRAPISVAPTLTLLEVHALAQLLEPLAHRSPQGHWKLVETCNDCIQIVHPNDKRLPMRRTRRGESTYWASRAGRAFLPEAQAQDTTLISRNGGALLIAFGSSPRGDATWTGISEPFALLRSSGALSFGAAQREGYVELSTGPSSETQKPRREVGEHEKSFWGAHVLWFVVLMTIIIILGRWLRRPLISEEP